MKKPLAIASSLLLLALVAALGFVGRGDEVPASASPGPEPTPLPSDVERLHSSEARNSVETGGDRRAVEPPPAPPRSAHATIRGRCVDENREPLPGCAVAIRSQEERRHPLAAWVRETTGDSARVCIETVSGADGTFALSFPPPPWNYELSVTAKGRMSCGATLLEMEPGATLDVGAIVLPPGASIEARVVDRQGQPVEDVSVQFESTAPVEEADGSILSYRRGMGTMGERVFSGPLPFGSYSVSITDRDYRLVEPTTISLVRERPVERFTVVVEERPLPRIRGRVIDESGSPVVGVDVCAREDGPGFYTPIGSDRDGRFRLVHRGTPNGPIWVEVKAFGFEPYCTVQPVPWGTMDLELRLRRRVEGQGSGR